MVPVATPAKGPINTLSLLCFSGTGPAEATAYYRADPQLLRNRRFHILPEQYLSTRITAAIF
jgi:hypothetical protein